MPVVPPEKLIQLQQAADNVRNICIMAHVVSARRAFRCNIC
jgi:ribosome assembly protein 1